MVESDVFLNFLHNTHIFASMVREILEEKYFRQATDLNITFSQFNLIRLIAINGEHQIREIANFLGVSQAAASKNVDKLVRLGLVKRQVQQGDRRASSLSLTVRSKNIIQKYEALKEEKLKDVLDGFSPSELRTLTRGLQKISFLILEREQDFGDICMKCNAYYTESCRLQALADGCIYTRNRKQAIQ